MDDFDMSTLNLKSMSYNQLNLLRGAVMAECQRRESLDALPITISDIARQYTEMGGSESDLISAVGQGVAIASTQPEPTPPPTEPEDTEE